MKLTTSVSSLVVFTMMAGSANARLRGQYTGLSNYTYMTKFSKLSVHDGSAATLVWGDEFGIDVHKSNCRASFKADQTLKIERGDNDFGPACSATIVVKTGSPITDVESYDGSYIEIPIFHGGDLNIEMNG